MVKSKYVVIVVSLVLIVTLLFLLSPLIKGLISVDDLEIKRSSFTCEDSACTYFSVVSNNTKEPFKGFFHIYGYTNNEGAPSLSAEEYQYIEIDSGKSLKVSQKFHYAKKPEFLEYSLRSNKYGGWLGSCNDGIYSFDIEKMKFTHYQKTQYSDGEVTYRIEEGTLKLKSDNLYEVKLEDEMYNFFVTVQAEAFRFKTFYPNINSNGYFQACDIFKAKELIENSRIYLSQHDI